MTWRIEGEQAQLFCGRLLGRVEFASVGVHFATDTWNGALADQLSVLFTRGPVNAFPLELHDWYVRGRDLVAQFEKTPAQRISPQIYWRAEDLKEFSAARVEMILSMQTELLDSAPQAQVHSFSHGGELWHADSIAKPNFQPLARESHGLEFVAQRNSHEQLFVFRDGERRVSYAQLVHPTDFVSARVVTDHTPGRWGVASTLFPERLEKGVIRRGRICGWFLPAENDLEIAVKLARQFVDEPLPLTT
jgi:hypothetical protein